LSAISARTTDDALNFVQQLFDTFAGEMVATDFQYGCLMQNLANELPALDAELTKRVARGFADSTEIIAEHFRSCGFAPARASSSAAALVADANVTANQNLYEFSGFFRRVPRQPLLLPHLRAHPRISKTNLGPFRHFSAPC
jgi:hypothetical protein